MKEISQQEAPGRRTLLKNLNPHLLCVLCAGYYIDPTTIVECLHSFCRSCIVKYLETSRFCPICDVQLHKTKPLLSIRRDMILERLVYKIVPRLYANEMAERALPRKELYFSPDDLISISLEYHVEDSSSQTPDGADNNGDAVANLDAKVACKKFLSCPAAVTVKTLKNFIISKYVLSEEHHQVEIMHASEYLPDYLSIMDIAYCFDWKKISRMELRFEILEKSTIAVPIVEEVEEMAAEDVVMEEDARSVASSSLPFMSPASHSDSDDASDTSLDSKPLIERLEAERKARKRKRKRETTVDEPRESEPEPKKSLFDSLLQNTTNNNENEDKDFQEESDEDYSKYEQDIEEIIEIDDESEDDGRLKISSNVSEDEVNHDETTSQMFVIDEEETIEETETAVEEEKCEKVTKEKHWKPEGRTKRKSKKAKHHHHHKRRLSQSPPPTATIVHSPDRDIMKLKVKLNTLPGYRHKDEKHHRHGKLHCGGGGGGGSASSASSIVSSPSRSSYKEDDSVLSEQSCDSVIAPKKTREETKPPVTEKQTAAVAADVRKSSQTTCPSPQVTADRGDTCRSETSSKESAPQTRGPRPKPPKPAAVEQQPVKIANAEPPPQQPQPQPQPQPQQPQPQPHKTIIMPPSSITVSIITAEEKMKMEKDKTLMLSGNHDFENKRPSLEIVRVNGPPASPPAVVVDVPRASPKPKEQQQHHHHHEEQQPSALPRPKTKKPVPAVIPIKSAKPALTIIPQNRSPTGNNHNHNNNNNNNNNNNTSTGSNCSSNCNSTGNNNGTTKHEEMQKNSLTISLENWSPNDSALDLSGKSSRKDTVTVTNNNKHAKNGGPYESTSMRNLMTLSDTAVHLRNMMSSSPSCKEPAAPPEAKKRFSNGNHHVGNNNINNGQGGSGSPKRHNGSVPLRIPVPPTSGSFKSSSSSSSSSSTSSTPSSAMSSCQNNNNKSAKVSAAAASAMSRSATDTKPKHGPPNQAVRHIPNPSVLLFRHHHQQLAQYAAAAAANAAAASAAAAVVNCNKRTNSAAPPSSPAVVASRIPQHQMPAAIPLHTIRKMENMKTIEKVAAGLSVKANALYKQNFIENGRARLELPS